MRFERVLVVDDDPQIVELIRNFLAPSRETLRCAGTLAEARQALSNKGFDLVVCDVQLPDGNGVDFLRETGAQKDPPAFIMMSGYGTIESATEAMRNGAADYLVKPFQSNQLDVAIARLERWRQVEGENAYLRNEAAAGGLGEILGKSAEMEAVRQLISRVAATDATVLIQGESGTGKELVAKAIHREGPRRNRPFIRLNCAAIPESLLESELFGHERGAFTGAHTKRAGRFELANGGTLLLDEISEMSIALQAKLLRVIQEREFERVGGTHTLRVDVRLLSTTNRDLEAHIKRGAFREDLYYRINVIPIRLPPLRRHPEDLEELLHHFLARFAEHHGRPQPELRAETWVALRAAPWPGNVRELQNCVERALLLSGGDRPLAPDDFDFLAPAAGEAPPSPFGEDLSLAGMEKRLIRAALERSQGRRAEAARLLGISLRTLQYKLRDALRPV
ncbi:MAG: sigma-54-dependent Fis family transcriptional regulator [Verrucomicrobiae bacterium]|nr:sigma-54-dependent Fis family transcriptional regulator [Verrucomicrobiae bacterium]